MNNNFHLINNSMIFYIIKLIIFWYFITMKNCVFSIITNFYFSFNVFIIMQWFTIKLFFNKLLILYHIALYFFSNSLLWTKRFIYLLLLSKYLTYPFIWGSFMHNGIGRALVSLIYPIKYLNKHFLSYKYFLDNTILLVSTFF